MVKDITRKDWTEYYEITKNNPPSKLLVKALEYVKNKNKAIDIGGGALKDTRYLLSLGFDVAVIDKDALMVEQAKTISSEKLHPIISSFEDFDFQENTFDIANAAFSLPFNSPITFDRVFQSIKNSLVKDGIFCGQFFGKNDTWATTRKEMTLHTKEDVESLLSDMEILYFNEEESDGTTANGSPKHWHIFHCIARKK